MQLLTLLLALSLASQSLYCAGNLIKIINNSAQDYTVSVHEHRSKKSTFPIVANSTWTGNVSLNNPIYITAQNKELIFNIEPKPTYLAVAAFKNQQKIDDIRINLQDIFNNSAALINKISLKKLEEIPKRSEQEPWAISLEIDKNNQMQLQAFSFDASTIIPGKLLQSYVVHIKP